MPMKMTNPIFFIWPKVVSLAEARWIIREFPLSLKVVHNGNGDHEMIHFLHNSNQNRTETLVATTMHRNGDHSFNAISIAVGYGWWLSKCWSETAIGVQPQSFHRIRFACVNVTPAPRQCFSSAIADFPLNVRINSANLACVSTAQFPRTPSNPPQTEQ